MVKLKVKVKKDNKEDFFVETVEDYIEKMSELRSKRKVFCEELEIEFLEGEEIDREVFQALQVQQHNVEDYLENIERKCFIDKITLILIIKEGGSKTKGWEELEECNIEIYEMDSLRDLAIHMVEEGYYGAFSKNLEWYIDYNKIACDLAHDYCEDTILGKNYVYCFY